MNTETGESILVIDDSYINNILFQSVLETEGYHVSVLSNPKVAFDTVLKFKPDLIILDIMMPVVDGLEILENLKKNDETKNIPVLMITADFKEESEIRAQKLGVSGYIKKPVPNELLIKQVRKCLVR